MMSGRRGAAKFWSYDFGPHAPLFWGTRLLCGSWGAAGGLLRGALGWEDAGWDAVADDKPGPDDQDTDEP